MAAMRRGGMGTAGLLGVNESFSVSTADKKVKSRKACFGLL
jgi:hypothetical protein